jgi:hypothetical protein
MIKKNRYKDNKNIKTMKIYLIKNMKINQFFK